MNKVTGKLAGKYYTTLACVANPIGETGSTAHKRLSSVFTVEKDGSYTLSFLVDINGSSKSFEFLLKAMKAYDDV